MQWAATIYEKDKLLALQEAVKSHKKYVENTINGRDVDNHLEALLEMAKNNDNDEINISSAFAFILLPSL